MFLEAASEVTGIFLPSQARLVGKKRDSPPFTSFQGFCAARVICAGLRRCCNDNTPSRADISIGGSLATIRT